MHTSPALLTRRRLLAGAGLLGLGWAARRRLPWVAAGPMPQRAYVWQRSWGPAVGAAVEAAGRDFSGLVALGAEISRGKGAPTVHQVAFDGEALGRSGVPLGLAIRVHGGEGDPGQREVQAASEAIEAARARAAAAGLAVGEVQIDLDCPASRLDAYRRWLGGLRPAVAGARLVITALPSWLRRPSFAALAASVDGYVLQVHGLERPSAGRTTLFDLAQARRAVDLAGALGAGFWLALPTYAYRLAFDAEHRLAGVAAEGPAMSWDESLDVQKIAAPAPEVAALVRSLLEARPAALAGLLWYRLPVAGDTQNWPLATLRAVQRGAAPQGRLSAAASLRPDGAWAIELRSDGDGEATLRGPVRVRWGDGQRAASDALGGFRERRGEGELWLEPPGPTALPPGERREVGWVRLAGEGQVRASVEEDGGAGG